VLQHPIIKNVALTMGQEVTISCSIDELSLIQAETRHQDETIYVVVRSDAL